MEAAWGLLDLDRYRVRFGPAGVAAVDQHRAAAEQALSRDELALVDHVLGDAVAGSVAEFFDRHLQGPRPTGNELAEATAALLGGPSERRHPGHIDRTRGETR